MPPTPNVDHLFEEFEAFLARTEGPPGTAVPPPPSQGRYSGPTLAIVLGVLTSFLDGKGIKDQAVVAEMVRRVTEKIHP